MELILNEPSADTGHPGPGTHLLQQNPQSDPGLAQVVDAIAETTKAISDRLRCFGLNQLRGTVGRANVHGEAVTCMDDYAHRAIVTACRACPSVAMVVSEEAEKGDGVSRNAGPAVVRSVRGSARRIVECGRLRSGGNHFLDL
jgi:fructose-1,6-bisphosphatase